MATIDNHELTYVPSRAEFKALTDPDSPYKTIYIIFLRHGELGGKGRLQKSRKAFGGINLEDMYCMMSMSILGYSRHVLFTHAQAMHMYTLKCPGGAINCSHDQQISAKLSATGRSAPN
jgi:hypothetical protein